MNNQNWSNNYGQPNYGQANQNWPNQFGWQRPLTNVILVTGIDEALMKSTERNSDYVYFNQDKPVFYRVKVDNDGRKAWQEFPYSTPDPSANLPATQGDIAKLSERLERIEKMFTKETENRPTTEVMENV